MSKTRRDKNLHFVGTQNIETNSLTASSIVTDSITATSANIPAGTTLNAQLSSALAITAQNSGIGSVTATVNTDYLSNSFAGNSFIITGTISSIQPDGPGVGPAVILVIESPDISGGGGGGVNSILTVAGSYADNGGVAEELKTTNSAAPGQPTYSTNADGSIRVRLNIPGYSGPTQSLDFTLFVSTFDLDIATA